jgi:nucleotide-binding universal stress UspA family protein
MAGVVAALDAGYSLAARDRAAVSIFSALRPMAMDPVGASREVEAAFREHRPRAEEALDAAADAAPEGVNPRTVLVRGEPALTLAEACDGIVDLVVTGSRAYGWMRRVVTGSVSGSLLERARHPFS